MEKSKLWPLICRLLLIVSCMIIVPYIMRVKRADFPRSSLSFPIWAIIISAATILAFVWLHRAEASSHKKWKVPSWTSNPFSINDPIQNFSDAAYSLMASGLTSMVIEVTSHPKTWSWEFLMSIGFGLWLGVWLSLIFFKNKFFIASDLL